MVFFVQSNLIRSIMYTNQEQFEAQCFALGHFDIKPPT